jgi:hypothetical protein
MSITESACSVNLVYSGELSPREKQKVSAERPYYSIGLMAGYEKFEEINFNLTNLGLTIPRDKEYVFYVIRHGQAEHNVKNSMGISSTMGMKYDTNLTVLGKVQAGNAAIELDNILKEKNDNTIDFFFSSDLVRSRQTIRSMLSEMSTSYTEKPNIIESSDNESSPSLSPIPDQKIIVLPCASEVETVGDGTGNCDSANAIGGLARENYPICTKANIATCNLIDNIPVDWSFYLEFYGGLTRRDYMNPLNRFNTKKRCRETNMISCAIEYLIEYLNKQQQSPRPVTPGGTKRRKVTKKRTRKTKSKKRAHKTKRTHRR